jgi:hypothetical protein
MKLIAEREGPVEPPRHHENFFNCIRGEEHKLKASNQEGHRAATVVQMANIAERVGSVLHFDPVETQITNNNEANTLIKRNCRDHWAAPRDVA